MLPRPIQPQMQRRHLAARASNHVRLDVRETGPVPAGHIPMGDLGTHTPIVAISDQVADTLTERNIEVTNSSRRRDAGVAARRPAEDRRGVSAWTAH